MAASEVSSKSPPFARVAAVPASKKTAKKARKRAKVTGSTRTLRRLTKPLVEALHAAKILGVRSGSDHRYTGVWVVVVEARVFVRTWNDKPTGWYRAFRAKPAGSIQVAGRELAVRAVPVKSERLRRAVSQAYGEKYPTKASQKWVTGFAEPAREVNTLELVPR